MKKAFFRVILLTTLMLVAALQFAAPASRAQSLIFKGEWAPDGSHNSVDRASQATVVGNTLYLANELDLQILDVTDPRRPQTIGSFNFDQGYGGPFESSRPRLRGNYLYLVHTTSGILVILDISNPAAPVRRARTQLFGGAVATAIAIEGDKLYVGKGSKGLEVFSLADPIQPVSLGTFPSVFVSELEVIDGLAYIAAGDQGFKIVDVTNPAAMWLVGGASGSQMSLIRVKGNRAYLSAYEDGAGYVKGFDISNPVTPPVVYSTPKIPATPDAGFCAVTALAIGDDKAIVGYNSSSATIGIFGLDDGMPGLLGQIKTFPESFPLTTNVYAPTIIVPNVILPGLSGLVCAGNYIYAEEGVAGLVIYDITDPANRLRLGVFDVAWMPVGVHVAGNLAFVRDVFNGTHILDISNPTAPIRKSIYSVPEGPAAGVVPGPVFSVGTRAYMGTTGGFDIIDVTDPANPVRIGGFRGAFSGISEVAVSGDYAFTRFGEIVDISAPANPTLTGTFAAPPGMYGLKMNGSRLYYNSSYFAQNGATNQESGDFNISDPLHPVKGGTVALAGFPTQPMPPYWYIERSQGLYNFDISNPDIIGSLGSTAAAFGDFAARSNDKVFITRWNGPYGNLGKYGGSAFTFWDVRDPLAPTLVAGQTNAFVHVKGLDAQGNYAYNLQGSGGSGVDWGYPGTKLQIFEGTLPSLAQPSLEIVRDGANLVLQWPKTFTGFKLYGTSALGTQWDVVTDNPFESGEYLTFTNTRPLGVRFYQLKK